jgi:hypothetical protein
MAERPRRTDSSESGVHLRRARGLQRWRSRRQMERHLREVVDAVRQKPFRFYGLPSSWEGRRALKGTSYGKKLGLRGVQFAHMFTEGRRPVTVYVSTRPAAAVSVAECMEEVELDFGLREEGDYEPSSELEWMRMRIPVDGDPTDFEVIAGRAGEWGAVGAVEDVVVGVEVQNFAMADVVLETVTDVEVYLSGPAKP